jgi:tetratricopeptide (TPR) repeat protein
MIRQYKYFIISILAFGLALGSLGWTQTTNPDNQTIRPLRVQRNNDYNRKLMVARQLMGQQNYEGAAALLETLLDENPDDNVVCNLLLQCYQQLKQYFKAEVFAKRLVDRYPTNLAYRMTYAELLAQQGKNDEAIATYRDARALIRPFDEMRFSQLISSMMNSGFDDLTLQLIDSLRTERNDTVLFALPKGAILEKEQEYAAAVKEYYPLLFEDTTMKAVNAEKRVLSLLGFVDSSEKTEKALLALSGSMVNERILDLLAAHYIRSEQFDKAYEFSVRQDSIQNSGGKPLMHYMQQCQERKLWPEVIRMGEYMLSRYPGGIFHIQSMFVYAEALAGVGRTDSAIAVYSRIASDVPADRDRAEALFRIGELYLNGVHDYSTALTYFDSVAANYRQGMGYLQSLRRIPYCYLRLGDLETASAKFGQLLNMRLPEDVQEEVHYYLALISFFRHDFDTADAALRKLVIDYPEGFYVNDALELVSLKTDAGDAADLLGRYADALFYSERMMPDSARDELMAVVDAENKALADIALYKLTLMELNGRDSSQALVFIDQLANDYPDSYYLPYGLNIKADILVHRAGSVEEAKSIYRMLLEKYPNYPFISDVRKKLRRLEADVLVG